MRFLKFLRSLLNLLQAGIKCVLRVTLKQKEAENKKTFLLRVPRTFISREQKERLAPCGFGKFARVPKDFVSLPRHQRVRFCFFFCLRRCGAELRITN